MSLNLSLSNAVLHTQRNIEYEIDVSIHTTFFYRSHIHVMTHVTKRLLNIYTSTKLKP